MILDTATTSVPAARCPGWSFQLRSHSQLCRNAKRCRQPMSVSVRAEKGGLQQLFKKNDDEVSFKWDAANLRWTKSKGKMADDADMMVRPKIGAPYMVWPAVHNYLTKKKLKTISPKEAQEMQQKGKAVLVDVREQKYFNQEHAANCLHVGLFRPVEGRTRLDNLKRLAMAGFAMEATERNPDFRKEALETLPKNKTICVMCSLGGTILVGTKPREMSGKVFKTDPDREFGRESRSLKACYELFEAGFKNIIHVEGGFPQWRYDKLPTESS